MSSILINILVNVILVRVSAKYEVFLDPGQMGFRAGKGTIDEIYCITQGGSESPYFYNVYAYHCMKEFAKRYEAEGIEPLEIPYKPQGMPERERHRVRFF